MRSVHCREVSSARASILALLFALLVLPTAAQRAKTGLASLDDLSFSRPELRVSQTLSDAESIRGSLDNLPAMDGFRAENGVAWHFLVDERTGRVNLLEGGAIPFIPGPANKLSWKEFDAPCQNVSCIPLSKLEALARDFLTRYQGVFKVNPNELALDPMGSVPIGPSIYFLRFQWVYKGVPVDRGSVFFRINNGNLIQVALENIGPISLDPAPTLSQSTAWQILDGFVGGLNRDDLVLDPGSLVILPITPRGMDPNIFDAPFGTMIGYDLAYALVFRRPGVQGTWEALVDAHTGEILRFMDANEYGHIQGGVYKTDKNPAQTEVTAPFPKADYGSGLYANVAGDFPGTAGICTMAGLNAGSSGVSGGVMIADNCGIISLASDANGLIDFGTSGGADCTTPGTGGAGNTHASRTQYWNVTEIKMKAISYMPSNTWLQDQLLDNVNLPMTCNAYWDGTALNFFQSGGGCGNTGELPGVSLHEWGHGMDDNDGSGTRSPPIEARADWTALLQTHQSCVGGGFWQAGTCSGYGDSCISCTGIRDADWNQHISHTPWTPANNNHIPPGYSCSSGSYNGPCGWEDHCEAGYATQALWDFVNRDLVGPPTNMDLTSAWQLEDRLFYMSMPTLGMMYTCTPPTSNGCGGGSLYTTMRAIDDDGDGTANGTPHAAAIFAALDRHNIACGAAGDATNQNHTSCPSQSTPTLDGTAGNAQNVLSWTTGGGSTTRYLVFRNETDCSAGFTRIATVSAPTLSYTDTLCSNGVTYYYRIQAATGNDSCVSPMSNCMALTPQAIPAPRIVISGAALTLESCLPANGYIDPGETVTVNFTLQNNGNLPTTNLVATLQATGGVTSPSGPQTYGALAEGGGSATMPFSFTASGACGETLQATLQLQDGATDLSTVGATFTLGPPPAPVGTFSNSGWIVINDNSTATPYPSPITVSGIAVVVSKVTCTISGFTHTWPSDVDIMLAGPGGQTVALMFDAGGGYGVSGKNLTFDDAAAKQVPAPIVSGTYRPTNKSPGGSACGGDDTNLPAPAPPGPYGSALSVFNGINPNGAWNLYVRDDCGGNSGSIPGGWSLSFLSPSCCTGGCPTITLSPPSLPGGTAGTAYSQTITASGGTAPYSYAVSSGTLPPGLNLSPAGVLSGTPTTAGTSNFTVTATDANSCTGSKGYGVTIAPSCAAAITLSPASLPGGTVGTAYSQTITASGGTAPYSYTVASGTPPPGLILSSAGVLSGTPTTAGTFNFTVTATDANSCTGSKGYGVTIAPSSCPTIMLLPQILPGGTVGTAYSRTITAMYGTAPYSYTVTSGGPPTGLTLSSAGVLSGKPTAAGTFTFAVTATDAKACTGTRGYSIQVVCPAITLSPATLPVGTLNEAYNKTITATGGIAPYSYAVTTGNPPTGLNLAPGGLLSGTPTATGTFNFTVTATDAKACTGSHNYSVVIASGTAFLDDLGRSKVCIDPASGNYTWTILQGPNAGHSYAGTSHVTNTATLLTLISLPGNPLRISFYYYYKNAKMATGTFQTGAVASSLVDGNTTNDPPGLCP